MLVRAHQELRVERTAENVSLPQMLHLKQSAVGENVFVGPCRPREIVLRDRDPHIIGGALIR
jgi:hypothetical protein